MYQLIREFRRKMDWSQKQFADEAGIDQAQVSRLEGGTAGGKFKELCDHLRNVARKHPRKWLELLSEFDTGANYSEFEDLFFLTENLSIHDFSELWVISELPAEVTRVALRQQLSKLLRDRDDVSVTYWVPKKCMESMWLLARNFENDGVSINKLEQQVRMIVTPPTLTLIPVGLLDPRTDNTIGVLSPRLPTGDGLRMVVLPKPTSKHICSILEPYIAKLEDGENGFVDEFLYPGFEWEMWDFAEIRNHQVDKQRRVPVASKPNSKRKKKA